MGITHKQQNEGIGPQYDSFVQHGLWDILRETQHNTSQKSKELLDLVLDGIIEDNELCKTYFGELWCEELETKLRNSHSKIIPHGKQQIEDIQHEAIEEYFTQHQQSFYQSLSIQIAQLTKKIETRESEQNRLKSKAKKTLKEDPELTAIKKTLSANKKLFKQLQANLKDNKEAIARIIQKIEELEKKRDELTKTVNGGSDSYDETKLTQAKQDRKKLQEIINGKDSASGFYREYKQQFIETIVIPALTLQKNQTVKSYNKEQYVQQQQIATWIKGMLLEYKISISPSTYDTISNALSSEITMAKTRLLTVVNLKEHLFSVILEFIQILYLEEILQELHPDKNIKVYKAPCVDDIRANTDCIIRVTIQNEKKIVYLPVDLKNSNNEEYLGKEQRKTATKHKLHGLHHCINPKNQETPQALENHILSINPNLTNILFNKIIALLKIGVPLPKKLSTLLSEADYKKIQQASPYKHAPYNEAISSVKTSIHQLFVAANSTKH